MDPVDLLFFGGTGDLAMRKLLPALYNLDRDGVLDVGTRVVGVAREPLDRDAYVRRVEESCERFVAPGRFDRSRFNRFAQRLHYVRADVSQADALRPIGAILDTAPGRTRVFYLSTSPHLFGTIASNLATAGLATEGSRIVLEKPIGRDVASAQRINEEVGRVFRERQVFRIDHYLGKEPVQNLMALRFGNVLFEPLWNRTWVHDVQISIAEQVGIEGRGEFYDRVGALRDMVQSHLLQLLCILAMEPPSTADPNAVRDEKLKVLRALKPYAPSDLATQVIRGQYRGGAVGGQAVAGYLDEPGIPNNSRTETFVAMRAEIANWRWAGVPFFLRTGKRMRERTSQLTVNFRSMPHSIFPDAGCPLPCNRLVIELQPEEELELHLLAKTPGEAMRLSPVHLSLDFAEQFATRPMDAYERLLVDICGGHLRLFLRRDEVDQAWQWIEPVLQAWEQDASPPLPYAAGSWGPDAGNALIARERTAWPEAL